MAAAGIGCGDALMDLPAEALGLGLHPAREGGGSGNRTLRAGERIGPRIERLDVETVGRSRHEPLVEIGAFQRLFHEAAPHVIGRRRKAVGEFEWRFSVGHGAAALAFLVALALGRGVPAPSL